MTGDRKAELAQMCRLEIRRASAKAKMALADYGYHLAMSVFDAEFQAMLDRLEDKPFDEHDIPALMELVMEDLWPRLRETHREHRDYVFDAIKKMNRETISEDASFAFDIGWRQLLQSAAERLETYPSAWKATITGGKEKFGCLVLHIACDYDQRGCRSELERLREEIRLRSLSTCDICSGQGRLRLSSIAKTVCDKHAAVLGDLREDDGQWSDPWHWRAEQPIEDRIADVIAKARAIMAASEAAEIADVQAGLDELDRGEHVDIDDVLAKARAIVDTAKNPWTDAVDVSLLDGMDPPLKRGPVVASEEMDESNDPLRMTELGRRIDDDIWSKKGREQELLIEFSYYIEAAVNGAVVKQEYLGKYIEDELSGWGTYARVPLSESDREWLHGYLRELIDAEYERVKRK